MTQYPSREARQRFFQLIRQAHAGEPAVVTLDGLAVAAIISYADFRRLKDSIMSETIAIGSTDLERHALAIAGGDADKAALILSEALTRLLARRQERDQEQESE